MPKFVEEAEDTGVENNEEVSTDTILDKDPNGKGGSDDDDKDGKGLETPAMKWASAEIKVFFSNF